MNLTGGASGTATRDLQVGRELPLSLGPGRRVWVGGDTPWDAYGSGKRVTKEVIVPSAQCVYSWLGCEGEPEVGNLCQSCADRDAAEELQRQRDRKNEYARSYYAREGHKQRSARYRANKEAA